MGLRDIGATLPPGFRFYPNDEELVCYYLYKKIANEESLKGTLVEIDLHTCEPWQLPEVAKLNATEWYFFSFRDRKYATGFRTNRATTSGYWKATGKDRMVVDPRTQEVVGMRKTLVFYRNRAPNGIKTGWIMHEFRLETPHMPPKEDWVLCRVFHKSKGENGAILSPSMMFETTTNIAPSLSILTTPDQTMPCGYQQMIASLSSNPPHHQHHSQSLLNLLQYAQENSSSSINTNNNNDNKNNNPAATEVSSKEDEYGFLWDMSLDNGAVSNLEDMRFEMDNSTDFL
ncbi:hypothetical protein SLE2022_208590 [Rubroshorea leprosula]